MYEHLEGEKKQQRDKTCHHCLTLRVLTPSPHSTAEGQLVHFCEAPTDVTQQQYPTFWE